MENKFNESVDYTVKRINGYLHKITPVFDATGKLIQNVVTPFAVELRPRDIMQIIIGAIVLAVPVGLTEETWILAQELPLKNIYMILFLSLFFLSVFIYFNFYRFCLKGHLWHYIKRIFVTYALSALMVGILLTIIQKCPWGIDNLLAFKRIILTTFPASLAATISDNIK